MKNTVMTRFILVLLAIMILSSALLLQVLATSTAVLDDQVTITDNKNKNTVSEGTVTIKAEGGLIGRETNTITITCNPSDDTQVYRLTFNYSASNYASFNINGAAAASPSGEQTLEIAAGTTASVEMAIQGIRKMSAGQALLLLSNFVLNPVVANPPITFTYDADACSSVSVDSTVVANNSIIECTTGSMSLSAEAKDGATFLGWINTLDGKIWSFEPTFTLIPSEAMVMKPVFVKTDSTPWFMVGKTNTKKIDVKDPIIGIATLYTLTYYDTTGYYMFDDLNDATTCATQTKNNVVVLMNSGTLPDGQYEIPSGVTLLIPYDSAHTIYHADIVATSSYVAPSAYRTLTIPTNTTITVKGALNVNAQPRSNSNRDTGCVSGKYGYIKLEDGAQINIPDDGSLYCYGYISGDGKVTAQNGATVYELFQMRDWVGGSTASKWAANSFMMSQYYMQNIECTYEINHGASAYVTMQLTGNGSQYKASAVYIGPYYSTGDSNNKGLFQLTSGSKVVREYNATDDRIEYTLLGTIYASSMDLSLSSFNFDTSEYVMGLNNRMTIIMESGSTAYLTEDFKMLPGVRLHVKNGSTLEVSSGAKLYIYDEEDWFIRYTLTTESSLQATGPWDFTVGESTVKYSPTRGTATKLNSGSAKLVVDGTLIMNGNVYTTAGSTGQDAKNSTTVIADPKSADKIITGTGTIINKGSWTTSAFTETNAWFDDAANNYEITINTIPAAVYLAGISEGLDYDESGNATGTASYDSIAAGTTDAPVTYYGRLNDYWYQSIINTEGTGSVEVTSGMGTKGSALSSLDARTDTSSATYISNIIGCVANGANTFTFTAPEDICLVSARNASGDVTVAYDSTTGMYSLSNLSADTTIVLTTHTDANSDHICENTGCGKITTCVDTEGNLKCDLGGCSKPMARLYSMNANADARTELVLKFLVHKDLASSLTTTVDFGSDASAEATVSGLVLDSESGHYVLTVTQPVASGEMTLPVTVSFTDGANPVCTVVNATTGSSKTSVSRSVADYAKAVLQSDTAGTDARELVTALVTYGGYAQKFFHEAGYEVNVDNLAYDILGSVPSVADVDAGDITEVLTVPDCFTSVTQDAHLEAAIWQDVYFVLADGYTFATNNEGKINLTLSYKETVNGDTKTGTLIPDVDENGRYYIRINNIPAAFLDYSYKIVGQVTKDGVTTDFEIKPSITSYLGRLLVNSTNEKQKDLAKAMWQYNQVANTFFNETPETAETEVTA